jgi:hypothetical protein
VLVEQLEGKFNLKASDFYPSYPQPDGKMVSRIYVEILPT